MLTAVVLCAALVRSEAPQLGLRRGVRTAVWRRPSSCARAPIHASSLGVPQDDLVEPSYEPRPANRHVLRASSVLPLGASVVYGLRPDLFDSAVQSGWAALCAIDATHSPMFEAQVAAGSFFVWIVLWSSVHLVMGERAKVHRFDGKMPHDPFSWTRPGNWHEAFNPVASYLGSIYLFHLLHPKAALVLEAPSFGRLCGEVLTGIVLYDLAFYPLHYLMHNLPFRPLRAIHGFHHRKGHTLNALETVQHSYADGLLQVAVNILVQQVSFFPGAGGKHPLSRILHNVIVTYLLTESHSGYRDLPFMSHRLWPELFGGSERHEAHHHNGKVCYHQFFKYIDDAFGWNGRDVERAPQPRTLDGDASSMSAGEAEALLSTAETRTETLRGGAIGTQSVSD